MASIISKVRSDILSARKEAAQKAVALRDPEVKAALVVLGRLAGKAPVSISNWYGSITVTIGVNDLDSFKVGPLPALLEKLMDAGVEFRSSSDYAQSGNRDFGGSLGKVSVRVAAYLSEASKQCVIKVVGEETITKPIYAIQC